MNDGGHHLSRNSGKSGWELIAIVIAVIALIAGLVILGTFIFFLVALNSWGSNK